MQIIFMGASNIFLDRIVFLENLTYELLKNIFKNILTAYEVSIIILFKLPVSLLIKYIINVHYKKRLQTKLYQFETRYSIELKYSK